MGVSQLQGTPWHIEIMHGEKGEKKRSKLRCAHYDPLTKKCRVKQECGGTMYCTQYSALGKNTYKKRKETVEEIKKLHAKGYSTEEIDKILQYKKSAQKAVTSKKQEKSAPKECEIPDLKGKMVLNPSYGEGIVIEQKNEHLIVKYDFVGEKLQDAQYLLKHGLIKDQV